MELIVKHFNVPQHVTFCEKLFIALVTRMHGFVCMSLHVSQKLWFKYKLLLTNLALVRFLRLLMVIEHMGFQFGGRRVAFTAFIADKYRFNPVTMFSAMYFQIKLGRKFFFTARATKFSFLLMYPFMMFFKSSEDRKDFQTQVTFVDLL